MRLRTPRVPLLLTTGLALSGVAWSLAVPQAPPTQPPPSPPGAPHALPSLPPEAGLAWEVRDADTGEPIPCKLTLIGVAGTPRPVFTKNDIGRQEGEAIAAYDRLMSSTGI